MAALWATQLVVPEPLVCKTYPEVPPELGNVKVYVPAASAVVSVTVPEVVPLKLIAPVVPEAVPIVMVELNVGAVP